MNTQIASPQSVEMLLRTNATLNDPATLRGIDALVDKLAPLVQSQRFHNVIDLLSATSDVVDMADDAMVQKMMQGYEGLITVVFGLNNTLRYASAQAGADKDPPSVWQALRRLNRDQDARRGLAMILATLSLLGQQARQSGGELTDD